MSVIFFSFYPPVHSVALVITYCLLEQHLVDNHSIKDGSSCQNVNN